MLKPQITATATAIALPLLFALNLFCGAVDIPWTDVAGILTGMPADNAAWGYIVLQSRLPQAIVATLSGASLAACGLMLQTAFANPLADPSIFGISSGAALGAAIAILMLGGTMSVGAFSATGFATVLLAAFAGAMAIMAVILLFSMVVSSGVMLLIVGIMVGYLTSSAISLLNFFATEEGVKTYLVWGMGHFGGVSMSQLPSFAITIIIGLALSLSLAKPLNALLLGERYAANLGIKVKAVRFGLLLVTGLLTAIVTAFCGPVSFLGLAVPHIARMITQSDNHRILIPCTMALGAAMALACNLICNYPANGGIIPLNAVTPLFGAPIVIHIIIKRFR